jgi:hypothetical protein
MPVGCDTSNQVQLAYKTSNSSCIAVCQSRFQRVTRTEEGTAGTEVVAAQAYRGMGHSVPVHDCVTIE